MLDQGNLKRLKQTSANGDWIEATDVAVELSLEAKGTPDEFFVEELELAVRLKDAERLAVVIDELNRAALD